VLLDEAVGAVAQTESGNLIAATPSGLVDIEKSKIVCQLPNQDPNLRMNDGKADPLGRFVGGTMTFGDPEPKAGSLWSFGPEGVQCILDGVTISNGLDWSDDGKSMFYIDTPTQRIDSFDYDLDTGRIGNRRTLIEIPVSMGSPDGMCVDAEGGIWVALWGGGSVIRIVDSKIVKIIEIPTPQVTSVAFVGADLDQLVITTASIGLKEQQDGAGNLYIYPTNTSGKQANRIGNWIS
jgi:sugar lactone lactonase YvrE